MIGPLGRLGAAATLGQHCPQMTQRRCTKVNKENEVLNDSLGQVEVIKWSECSSERSEICTSCLSRVGRDTRDPRVSLLSRPTDGRGRTSDSDYHELESEMDKGEGSLCSSEFLGACFAIENYSL